MRPPPIRPRTSGPQKPTHTTPTQNSIAQAPVVKAAKAACAAAFPLTRATAIMKMQSASAAITGHSAA